MASYYIRKHFELLDQWQGRQYDKSDPHQSVAYEELKEAYQVTEDWAKKLAARLFPDGHVDLVKRPTNQANRFAGYNWAKIYPISDSPKQLAYTVGIDAAGIFCVKIDTVGLADNDPMRVSYVSLRGEMDNSSPFVAVLTMHEGLALGFDGLVEWSANAIGKFKFSYDEVVEMIGLLPDGSRSIHLKPMTFENGAHGVMLKDPPPKGEGICMDIWVVCEQFVAKFNHGPSLNDVRSDPTLAFNPGTVNAQFSRWNRWRNWGGTGVSDRIDQDEKTGMASEQTSQSTESLNQILFGPPGTGKTFHLQQLLTRRYTEAAATVDPDAWRAEQIASRIATLTWWEALGAALYETGGSANVPQLSKHPYVVAVASKKGRAKGVSQTLWGTLQNHALEESETVNVASRIAPFVFDKSADSVWRLDGAWKEDLADVVALVDDIRNGPLATGEAVRRYEFVTFHQSFSYEDFMEGLTPVVDEETGNLRYDVRKGVFLRLCDRARLDPTHQYAMIIDEINRGNVSKVLGELITLIEVDKRAGALHEISLTLPYSGERFSVPSNIDFIGTMNTADRSLTGLDIALRRRFNFVEMPADPGLLRGVLVEDVDIKLMLERINERIEVLLDRDHQLGHAYFMPLKHDNSIDKLSFIFRNQILPLLQEYFFEDWQRIQWVLNDHRKADGHRFVIQSGTNISSLFGTLDELPSETKRWKLDTSAFGRIESYRGIADAGASA